MNAPNNFVLGFAFDIRTGAVALIQKKRPEWQAGKWNGIGGRIEEGETPLNAMVREFAEETGIITEGVQWHKAGTMLTVPREDNGKSGHWMVHVFTMREALVGRIETRTDEQVWMFSPDLLKTDAQPCIENIPALIELCRIPKDYTSTIPTFRLVYP